MTYTNKKFNGHTSAQAYIRTFSNGTIQLISYNTVVIEISPEEIMTINGLYSRTTIKHIGWFMHNYNLDYAFAKFLYANNFKYNMVTKEILPEGAV